MKFIAAVDKNWAIGNKGRLLIRISEDQRNFRQTTMGHVVVLGRKTLEEFPGGISGISIIVRRLSLIAKESWKSEWLPQSGIPIWLTNIMLDIPLFIWAYCKKGIDYIKDTLAADALLTFFMAVLPADTRVDVSYLKTAIIGGIMAGVGIGMVLRTEITTGGTDVFEDKNDFYIFFFIFF